mmetsp:Transcript_2045/g.6838  ORF Transcript_2045/g.6838 Transcript_2045/m.6838 type:complete len:477 (+) Transcript_2045:92-1522(+)
MASTEVLNVVPDAAPRLPEPLVEADDAQRNSPPMQMCFLFRDRLDQVRLQEAFGRVVSKNPEIAGRARSTGRSTLEIHFSGPLGCPFYVKPLQPATEEHLERLSSEAVVSRSMGFQQLLVTQVGIESTGITTDDIIDKDGPLCVVTYCPGSRLSMLCMSLCHLVGDAWTYFALLRSWEEEYSGSPSAPLTRRVDLKLSDFVLANTPKIVPTVVSFFRWALMGRLPRSAVSACMSDAQFAAFRAQEAEKVPSGLFVSENDAFLAWVANQLGSKLCAVSVCDRGKGSRPPRSIGNGFCCPFSVSAGGSGRWSPLDIRRVVATRRSDNDGLTFRRCGLVWREEVLVVSNWAKVQHVPCFGSQMCYSVIADAAWYNYALPCTITYKPCLGELVALHTGLESSQAARLEASYKRAGISSTIIPSEEIRSATAALRTPAVRGGSLSVVDESIRLLSAHRLGAAHAAGLFAAGLLAVLLRQLC